VARALAGGSVEQFLARLPGHDAAWQQRVAREAARGRVLRYVVTATPRGVSAGLRAVPRDSPFGSLSGTRNLLSFTTRRYHAEPLVVAGPGAGPEVTAAGILNDIHSLGSE
jgi:homoserine dehydrogenase